MTQQLDPGAVRRVHSVVRRKAGTFRLAVYRAHRHGGGAAAVWEGAALFGDVAVRPLRKWRERRLDRHLQLDTRADGALESAGPAAATYDDGVAYAPTPLHHWLSLRRRLPIAEPSEFAFIDLGCGKGRMLFIAAEHGFGPVIGVELDPRLAQTAHGNVRAFKRAAPRQRDVITVVNSDAVAYQFPPVPSVVFLFNPFGADTMRAVLANLERSLESAPRRLLVAYVNPVHRDVMDACPALRVTATTRGWVLYETGG